ncbi:MAG TPA: heme ABC transporter ATP-binding protein [Halanaerobiales bacterium]|nr:heme ABC transporter ATP-binding protein [Halanaerobiales bacterium]
MLNIKNLSFKYKNEEVLKDIDYHLEKNDFVGIIGPNGSGKSTLLKNISRILNPNKGVIYLDQKLLNQYSSKELAKKMAVVPQNTNVDFNFTVYDIIMMGRNPYQGKWGKINEKDSEIVNEVMEVTDTKYLEDKKINQLSGGERQRVIIARSLAQKPDLLLLDEPTSSLDINYQGEIFDLISELNQKLSLTIIVVSHDLNLASQYCDELILLSQGKIYAVGSPEEVLTEKNIREVYNTEVIIKRNNITDRPYVTLVPRNYQVMDTPKGERIHIVAGGGSGSELFKRLNKEGYTNISCGVLNQGDRDWETARKLNYKIVEIPPFDYVGEISSGRNKEEMEKAEIIIVTNTPFGHGNLGNLKTVSEMNDKDIIVEAKKDFSYRDYTDGKAQKFWKKIIDKNNTHIYKNTSEIIKNLNKLLD